MLTDCETYTVLPASDLTRARTYYSEMLGLEPTSVNALGLFYRSPGGSLFHIYETTNAGTAQNTQMGWITANIDAEVAALKARGVVFEDYDFPGLKTVDGIASLEGERAAWFIDSEGNYLHLSQPAA
jgi:catechol-2,3-dioxygenase